MPLYTRPFAPDEQLTEEELEQEKENNNPPRNAEDSNWKDRYGNLRSYSQRKENEWKEREAKYQEQIASLTKREITLPTSPEQVSEWARQYPDVAKIVETIAIQKASEQTTEINKRLESIAEKEEVNKREAAQLKLAKAHPDFFDDIRGRDDFHQWLATKSKRIQDVIYGDDYDADAAIDVVSMYKQETNTKPARKPAASSNDAARAVPNKARVARIDNNEAHFSESQVARMSAAEYAKNEEAIDKAINEGRFEYDMSDAS